MGRWAYYSPLWLGPLLVLAMNEILRAKIAFLEPRLQWLLIILVAILFGLKCQVLMIGAQGAFAQVLPVPWGKSIRGGAAMLGGWLLIVWFTLSVVAGLLHYENMSAVALILGLLSLATLGGAIVVYVWNIPAAIPDFGREGRRGF